MFRYEVRCWFGGSIPHVAAALGEPLRVTRSSIDAGRIIDLVPEFLTCAWGREELETGEMCRRVGRVMCTDRGEVAWGADLMNAHGARVR